MTQQGLGRLEKVNLRQVWSGEATDFTPWLAEKVNLDLLGGTLGMKLELEAQEQDVGSFRADIVCKDTADGSWVIIENQLERTNHTHLGQILTYAAGLSAVTIVWIAQRFTDEHRAALDWLNDISGDGAQFVGLEIELWRIGKSPPAPKFNIVAKPNNWTRSKESRTQGLTPTRQMQLDFWLGFREFVLDKQTPVKPGKPQPLHYMNISLGRSGFRLSAVASLEDSASGTFSSHELRAGLYIHDQDHSKKYFELLQQHKDEIEKEMGCTLVWYNPQNARPCTIFVRRTTNLEDSSARDEQYAWLLKNLELLYGAFVDRVQNLDIPNDDFANDSGSQ